MRLFALWAIPYASVPGDPNFAPDEQGHMLVARALAHGQLLRWPEQTWTVYAVFPPSQDVLQAATLAFAEKSGLAARTRGLQRFAPWEENGRDYLWLRLGSALASALACLFLAAAAARFSRDAQAGLWAGLACALEPQLAFLGGYVNPDALTICAGAALVAALARWSDLGEGRRGLPLVGAACGFVLLAKASGFFLLPPTALWLFFSLGKRKLRARDLLAAAGCALTVALPALALNTWKNRGDPLGVQAYARYLETVWKPKTWAQVPHAFWFARRQLSASSFGLFGNMSLPLPAWEFIAFGALVALGLACALALWPRASEQQRRGALWLVAALLANALLELHHLWFVDFQPQGRYVLLSVLLLLCAATLAPARLSARLRFFPAAMLSLLAVCAGTMEWLLVTRGR